MDIALILAYVVPIYLGLGIVFMLGEWIRASCLMVADFDYKVLFLWPLYILGVIE